MKHCITLLTFLFCFLAFSASAAPITDEQKAEVLEAQKYLNGITSMVAQFTQLAPDGVVTEGTFFLKRPGNIRWQYDPPTPILIVGKGKLITYYDYELEQISYVSLDDALASFLTQDTIDFFSKDIVITDVAKAAGVLRIALAQKDKPEEGSLTLVFSSAPAELKKMEVTDASGQVTYVTFTGNRYGVDLDKKLFVIPNPQYSGKATRRRP